MLAHVDVVEAKREDWTRDPFTLVEEDGYFYGRGTSDMKAQAAIWVDNLIRYREEGYQPKRSIKLALTCGEETDTAVNGANWLTKNDPGSVDAELALTEGFDGGLDAQGHPYALYVLAAEKTYADYLFEVTNPGGHSSRPVPDNAIYHLVRAVDRVSRYEFPVQLDDANRGYFLGMSKIYGGEDGAAMAAIVAGGTVTVALLPAVAIALWHSVFALRFAWGYLVHDISACDALVGNFAPQSRGYEMDGSETALALLWCSLSGMFWIVMLLAWLQARRRILVGAD